MRVGLIGFGKTGVPVASVLLKDPTMQLVWVVRKSDVKAHQSATEFLDIPCDDPAVIVTAGEIGSQQLLNDHPVDVIIDFSSEEGLDYYLDAAAARRVNVVTAISHYSEAQQQKLRRLSQSSAVLWSPNITVGVNFLILAAQSLRRIAPKADIEILEEHFKLKDGVSGTAKLICEALEVCESEIKSVRAGGIIGVHEILFGFPYQVVRLRHESISREAFGDGARFAAVGLAGKMPGLYTMQDLMAPMFASAPPVRRRERARRRGFTLRRAPESRVRVERAAALPDQTPVGSSVSGQVLEE